MSEYINNVSKRKAGLREVIRRLHAGESVADLQAKFGEVISNATASEIAEAERDMIAEGVPVTDIQQLCDLHVAVFQSALDNEPAPEALPGHPIYEFRKENEVINLLLSSIEGSLVKALTGDPLALNAVKDNLHNLNLIETHFDRKENLLFPYLENYGFEGPSTVMWGVDNEIRAKIKNFRLVISRPNVDLTHALQVFKKLAGQTRDMVYKEEKVLIPEALAKFTPSEWEVIKAEYQSVQSAYATQETEATRVVEVKPVEETQDVSGRLPLSTGALSLEQINLMLTNLPVDITFVDENDEVRFFSQTRERIFTRTAVIIGRKVQKCHPPQSVHVVQKIVDAFKDGSRDVAEFWIEMGGKFINIRYFPLRDENGTYKGTIEVSQDVTHIRSLQGERRLLDD